MNVKKIKKDFAIILSVLISVLVIIGSILVMSIMKSISYQQLQTASNNIVIQTTDSFEFTITQIWEQLNKTTIYSGELAALATQRYQNSTSAPELYSRLRDIKMGSSYITAVYLYSKEEDRFLDANKGCSYLSEDFLDPMIHATVSSSHQITTVAPHLVSFSSGEGEVLCYTLIVPLYDYTHYTNFSLCVQIDLDKLCTDILNNKLEEGIELYICNSNGNILASSDHSVLGNILEQSGKATLSEPSPLGLILNRRGIMWAKTWSKNLNWYFCIQMPYKIEIPEIFNTYAILWLILLVMLLVTVMVYIILTFMMRPFQKAALELNEKHLKELLTDSYSDKDIINGIPILDEIFPESFFQVIVIDSLHNQNDFSRLALSVVEEVMSSFNIKIFPIPIQGSRIALICNYDQKIWNADKESAFLHRILTGIDSKCPKEAYLALSLQKTSMNQLPLAYKECEEIQNHKLYMKSNILYYKELADRRIAFTYPAELEKQLINNMLLGNHDGCVLYMEKFIAYVLDNEAIFSDHQIANAIYQIQNEILKRISSLPISINTSFLDPLPEQASRSDVESFITEFICYLSERIAEKNEKDENLIHQSIMDYIDSHFMDEDFNLNQISYQFNLNRNYLTRLIKETTGQSFNEYINEKKIAAAKELLLSTKLSIEEISHQTGFSYSHYFIKIFKSREGITPGQYREVFSGNRNAQG